jgi:hypothetical protein
MEISDRYPISPRDIRRAKYSYLQDPAGLVGRGVRMASQDRKQGPRGPAAEGAGGSRRGSLHSFADMHLHRVDFRGVSCPKRGGRSRTLHLLTRLKRLASALSDVDTPHVHGQS